MTWPQALDLLMKAQAAADSGVAMADDVRARLGDAFYAISVQALLRLGDNSGEKKAVEAMNAALVGLMPRTVSAKVSLEVLAENAKDAAEKAVGG